jgi:dihydroorotate dehydrogenase (fumarate)
MDLTTRYLGLTLKHPIVPSASPLSRSLAGIRQMEDAGAAAIVLYSLFEEQIDMEGLSLHHFLERGTNSFAESLTYFPEEKAYTRGPDEYLGLIQQAKAATSIPIVASLNGVTIGGWTGYARKMQDAGADALELNVYYIPTAPTNTGEQVEQVYLDVLREVKAQVTIPVAVKLSPQFSAPVNMAQKLDRAGADGLVLFNRFYQPDLDIETLTVEPNLVLSRAAEMRLPLRWTAILFGHVKASLALTTGVHSSEDAIKAVMAGADVANVCSVLLHEGIGKLTDLVTGFQRWMEEHEYESVTQMKGSLSQRSCPEPAAFERANYMKALTGYRAEEIR